MATKQKANEVINGTFGSVWIDAEKFSNIKSFEAKVTMDYEDVLFSEDLATHKKYMGWNGAGTAVLHKMDSVIASKVAEGIKSGDMPECTIVAKLADPASVGAERVQLTGVYFDEVTLLKFATKELGEEEVPFTFSDYEFLDMIR